jgi:hypothetical protein
MIFWILYSVKKTQSGAPPCFGTWQ